MPPLLFELVLYARPVSVNADSGRLGVWQTEVRREAQIRWGSRPPVGERGLYFSVGNFHEGDLVQTDADNIIKPIQDSLEHVVYHDDNQIEKSLGFRQPLSGPIHVKAPLKAVWPALWSDEEFVHIAVTSRALRHYLGPMD